MEQLYFVPVWALHAAFYCYGGLAYFVYVSLLSGVLCQLLTLAFNVAFHEHDEFDGSCHALDNWKDPLSNFFGEAYHLWHHVHPRAHHRPGLDVPYWLCIKPCLALGIFSGTNMLSANKAQ